MASQRLPPSIADDLLKLRRSRALRHGEDISDSQKSEFLSLFNQSICLVVCQSRARLISTLARLRGSSSVADYPRKIKERLWLRQRPAITRCGKSRNDCCQGYPITEGLKDFTIHDESTGVSRSPDITPVLTTSHPKRANRLAWCRPKANHASCISTRHDHPPTTNPIPRLPANSILGRRPMNPGS